mmetsp:Transcript_29879/g.83496  ORF Transcript_29879/g.83496 Transcript_29879/m.83496 type:complete len:251 (-) Transcript_29879:159-911(-)
MQMFRIEYPYPVTDPVRVQMRHSFENALRAHRLPSVDRPRQQQLLSRGTVSRVVHHSGEADLRSRNVNGHHRESFVPTLVLLLFSHRYQRLYELHRRVLRRPVRFQDALVVFRQASTVHILYAAKDARNDTEAKFGLAVAERRVDFSCCLLQTSMYTFDGAFHRDTMLGVDVKLRRESNLHVMYSIIPLVLCQLVGDSFNGAIGAHGGSRIRKPPKIISKAIVMGGENAVPKGLRSIPWCLNTVFFTEIV